MMKCLYLLSVVFHVTAGCVLSRDNVKKITQHRGGSVLLPCSCSDPRTKPQKLTWTFFRTGRPSEVLNDEHYRDRLQLFNNISPGNVSLLISDLREEDEGFYRCSTETEYRDIRINVIECALSGVNNILVVDGHQGGSVLLPCSCSDPRTKPQKITWMTFRTGRPTEVLHDEHYRDRLQLFNNSSPGNVSLLISDLREEDEGFYWCSTETEHRDIRINVIVGRKETSTRPKKPDVKPPTEQPQSKTTKSQPTSSSTTQKPGKTESSTSPSEQPTNSQPVTSFKTLEQDGQQNHTSFPLVFGSVSCVLLVILGVVALICWKRRGGRCGKNVITEEHPGYKGSQKVQVSVHAGLAVPDVTYSTVSHVNTARAAGVQINAEEKTEYASIITN